MQTAEGSTGRTIVVRLLPGTDVLEGIEEACRKYEIKDAVIACSIGCLKKATFIYAVPREGTKVGIAFNDPTVVDGPIEYLGGQGIVYKLESGEYIIHLHGAISDKDMRVYGAHFVPGNIVLTTLDLVINELIGVPMTRRFDEEIGFYQLSLV
jgi:predicted DNA-binding protein with PD1-like motif